MEICKTGTLGLPPDLPIDLDDELIRQFQLVDPEATALQGRVSDLQRMLGKLPQEPTVQQLRDALGQTAPPSDEVVVRLSAIDSDLAAMECQVPVRRGTMTVPKRPFSTGNGSLLTDSLVEIRKRYDAAAPRLSGLNKQLDAGQLREVTAGLVVWLGDVYRLIGESMLVQAHARLESVAVEPIELSSDDASDGVLNRLDIMNNVRPWWIPGD